jgi:ComF family protein
MNLSENIYKILSNDRCIGCSKKGTLLCYNCLNSFEQVLPECYKCRRISTHSKTHNICKYNNSLDQVIVFWKYNEIAKEVIKSIKYRGYTRLTSQLLKQTPHFLKYLPRDSIYTSVPLHPSKENQRGFNQVDLIAKELAVNKFIPDLIIRDINTKSQSSLSKDLRKSNVFEIFSINPQHQTTLHIYKNIVLIDDLITTGSTLDSISSLIKERHPNIGVSAIILFRGKKPKNYSSTTSPS